MTFSIVARDPATGDLAVAVQSRFLAIGATSVYAAAEVGAVVTQALTNVSYGPRALELLASGATAAEAMDLLIGSDAAPARRQAGIVDASGNVATHTGAQCTSFAGHVARDGFSCQGNMLVSAAVLDRMADAMTGETHLALPERLVAALHAGQSAGGDSRGQQSAALLVVRSDGGYGGLNDRMIDLRVDDHTEPIMQLQRLVTLHRVYFDKPDEEDLLPLEPLAEEIAARLGRLGYTCSTSDEDGVWDALERWAGRENLEERMTSRGAVDRTLLTRLIHADTSDNSGKDS